MWNFGSLNAARGTVRTSHANRSDGGSPGRMDKIVTAAIYKGSAFAAAGITGFVSSYKGMPEAGKFGFDLIFATVGSFAEAAMIYKGVSLKATAVVGGMSTGLGCHWVAVQMTLYGATKAKIDASKTAAKGWDYDGGSAGELGDGGRSIAHEPPTQHAQPVAAGVTNRRNGGFDLLGTV